MTFKKYQKDVEKTWISNNKNLTRILLGIGGEAGEILEAHKKVFRGDCLKGELCEKLKGEIGDLSYYIAKLCNEWGLDWEKLLEANIIKLKSRKKRGKIKGSGSDR